jgi:hypothetical protein
MAAATAKPALSTVNWLAQAGAVFSRRLTGSDMERLKVRATHPSLGFAQAVKQKRFRIAQVVVVPNALEKRIFHGFGDVFFLLEHRVHKEKCRRIRIVHEAFGQIRLQ